MFVGTALSVRLLVYAGLSLFIISGPYLYVVVCVLYAYNLTQDLLADPSSDSDGTNADNDHVPNNADIWRSEYARRCFETLKSVEFLTALISVLHQSGCLCDLMLLVTQLAEDTFSPMNIAFLLCLECAKWQSLITTTQMRFRAVTKIFWLVVY